MRRRASQLLALGAVVAMPALADARALELDRGRAPASRTTVLELERGSLRGPHTKVLRDRGAGGGRAVALAGRGSLRLRFRAPAGTSAMLLRARAVPCAGWPRVLVRVDGRAVAARAVRSRRYARHRLEGRLRAGAHLLRLALHKPRRARSCSRRVVLDSLSIRAPAKRKAARPRPVAAPPPTPPAPAPAPAAVSPIPPPEPSTPPGGYRNPVFAAPGAPDPMVLDVGGRHSQYLAFSTGDRFPILRSADLVDWTPAGTALRGRPDWAAQTGDWNPWAPSVIERPGACPGSSGDRCFVLFHVSRHATLSPPTNCIGVAVSAAPGGPYRELGPLEHASGALDASGRPPGCGDDAGYSNIDPAPFVDGDGRAYLYLSTTRRCQAPAPGLECGAERTISVIELTPDLLAAAGPRTPLFGADAGWEVGSFGPVVENPWPVRRGSEYVLLYSGGAYNGPYGMGYARSMSPTGPFAKEVVNPILREGAGVLSPGGGMLVTGPGGGDWLAYHGRQGSYAAPRELRIDRARFAGSTLALDGPTSAPQATRP